VRLLSEEATMVRVALLATLVVSISARAWAANPDCDKFNVSDPDKYLESQFNLAMSIALGCEKNMNRDSRAEVSKLAFVADLPGAQESQIYSAYYVTRCLDHEHMEDANEDYLLCGYDARRLDGKKLEAEIAERKLSPESATAARALHKKAQERNKWMIGELAGYKSDPNYDYKKLFVDVPEEAAVAWNKFYADHKDVYDLGTSIERQLSATDLAHRGYQNVEVKGCPEMHKAFKDYLATTQKGKLAPEVGQFLQADPLAFEMLSSLVVCDGMGGFKADAAGEYDLIKQGRMWRGPRFAAYWAALTNAVDTAAKGNFTAPIHKGKASINDHILMQEAGDIATRNFRVDYDPRSGKVAAIKKLSDGWVEVSFKLEKWMEPDFECVDVKPLHFNHWGQNGQPVWDWKCNVKGYHEESKQESPHAFSQTSAAGIKPGMLVKMKGGNQDKEPKVQAFPLEVSLPAKTKKDKPKLISFSGIPLQ